MKAPLNRAFKTLKEPSISYLYTARFQLATQAKRSALLVLFCRTAIGLAIIADAAVLQSIQDP